MDHGVVPQLSAFKIVLIEDSAIRKSKTNQSITVLRIETNSSCSYRRERHKAAAASSEGK